MKHGEGVWWSQDAQVYRFHDSDTDPDNHSEGPTLKHFHHTSLPDIYRCNDEAWHDLIRSHTSLPTTKIRIYKEDGTCTGGKHYPLPILSPTKTLCAPLTDHPSGDSLCTPLTDIMSLGSSDSLSESPADPSPSYICTSPSPSSTCTTVTSKGHTCTNMNFSLTSTPTASNHSHSASLKPTNLLTSFPKEKLALGADFSSQESSQSEREKDVSLMCDFTQLQQDVSKGIQLHTEHKELHEYKRKAAMLIGKVIDKHNPALKEFDDLRSNLKVKRAPKKFQPCLKESYTKGYRLSYILLLFVQRINLNLSYEHLKRSTSKGTEPFHKRTPNKDS